MASPWTRTQATPVNTSTGAGTLGLTWGSATAAGADLVAIIAVNAPASPPDVTIPAGSAWVASIAQFKVNSNFTVAIFHISGAAAHSGTETWGLSAGTRDMVGVMIEYAHSSGAGFAVDQSKTNNNTGSTSPSTGTTPGSTIGANDIVVSVIANINTSTETSPAGTPTGTFATIGNAISGNATGSSKVQGYFYEDKATAAGTAETHATLGTSRSWAGVIVAFKPVYANAISRTVTLTPLTARRTNKPINRTAVVTWIFLQVGGRRTLKAISRTATLTPTTSRRTLKAISRTATLTGAVARRTLKPISRSITDTPAVARRINKPITYIASGPNAWGRAVKRTTGKLIVRTATLAPTVTPVFMRSPVNIVAAWTGTLSVVRAINKRIGPPLTVGWGRAVKRATSKTIAYVPSSPAHWDRAVHLSTNKRIAKVSGATWTTLQLVKKAVSKTVTRAVTATPLVRRSSTQFIERDATLTPLVEEVKVREVHISRTATFAVALHRVLHVGKVGVAKVRDLLAAAARLFDAAFGTALMRDRNLDREDAAEDAATARVHDSPATTATLDDGVEGE